MCVYAQNRIFYLSLHAVGTVCTGTVEEAWAIDCKPLISPRAHVPGHTLSGCSCYVTLVEC